MLDPVLDAGGGLTLPGRGRARGAGRVRRGWLLVGVVAAVVGAGSVAVVGAGSVAGVGGVPGGVQLRAAVGLRGVSALRRLEAMPMQAQGVISSTIGADGRA